MLRAEPPWALASGSPSPRGQPSKLGQAGGAGDRGRLPAASSTAAGRTRGSPERRAPLLRPARGSRPAGRRRLPSCPAPGARGWDAAAARQAERMAVSTRVRSVGPEGRRRRRGSDAPRSAPRSSRIWSRRREGPPLPRSPAPRLFLRRPLAAAAPCRPRRHAHPEPRPRPRGAQTSLAVRTSAAGP